MTRLAVASSLVLVACTPLSAATMAERTAACGGVCMKGRVVLVTHATAGLGHRTALELGRMGAEVIVHGTEAEPTARAAAELKADWLAADLSSLDAVRALAADVKQRWGKLDVLINVGQQTNPGQAFAINHLAPFLLTNLLLPELMKGTKPRVVQVAAPAYTASPVDFDDLMNARAAGEAIPRAKAANLLFMRELAKRTAGTGLTVNAAHAGFGNIAHVGLVGQGTFEGREPGVGGSLAYLFAEDEVAGAVCAVYLASSEDVAGVTGTYFVEGATHEPKSFAKDERLQLRLWEISAQLTGLNLTR